VALTSLLEEVVFEMKDRGAAGGGTGEKAVCVTCHFVDGAIEDCVRATADDLVEI